MTTVFLIRLLVKCWRKGVKRLHFCQFHTVTFSNIDFVWQSWCTTSGVRCPRRSWQQLLIRSGRQTKRFKGLKPAGLGTLGTVEHNAAISICCTKEFTSSRVIRRSASCGTESLIISLRWTTSYCFRAPLAGVYTCCLNGLTLSGHLHEANSGRLLRVTPKSLRMTLRTCSMVKKGTTAETSQLLLTPFVWHLKGLKRSFGAETQRDDEDLYAASVLLLFRSRVAAPGQVTHLSYQTLLVKHKQTCGGFFCLWTLDKSKADASDEPATRRIWECFGL